MFIRFIRPRIDPDTKKNVGILVAAHTLRDDGDISVEQHRELRLHLEWFNKNLHIPPIYDDLKNRRALSWFKASAEKPIQRMWQLKTILDQHGCHVDVLKTTNPGRVVYEDGWQVVAIPARGQKFGASAGSAIDVPRPIERKNLTFHDRRVKSRLT